jgi:hypothetical protein
LKKSSNFVDLELRRELANSDLPPLPHQHARKNYVGFRGMYISMCGRNNNFTATNSEITLTCLQVWHDHKAHFTLGVRAIVQPKSSIPIGLKVEISPGASHLQSTLIEKKNSLTCPKLLVNAKHYGMYWPQG